MQLRVVLVLGLLLSNSAIGDNSGARDRTANREGVGRRETGKKSVDPAKSKMDDKALVGEANPADGGLGLLTQVGAVLGVLAVVAFLVRKVARAAPAAFVPLPRDRSGSGLTTITTASAANERVWISS